MYFSSSFFARVFLFPAQWIIYAPICATSLCIINIILASLQVRQKTFQYGIFINSQTLLIAVSSIAFIVVLKLNWKGQVISRVLITMIFSIMGIYFAYSQNYFSIKFNKTYLFHALSFGIPLVPHALSGIIHTTTDKILISHMIGIADTGLYTVGFQVGSVINLFATAFNQAYSPWLMNKLNNINYSQKMKIVIFTYIYFVVILATAMIFGMIAPFIINIWVGGEFHKSYIYVIWIALGYAFNGMYFMVVNYIFYAEKTYLLAITTFSTALLNVLLDYILIKVHGPVGAAQATTITYLINFILVWILSAKVYKMPWLLGKSHIV